MLIWSVSSFVFEVPSGAWADVVDRRALLIASAAISAAAFTTWMLWPVYAGFAVGFVLWGLSGALMSGTFEAFLYDELAARDATDSYASIQGWAESAATAAVVVATAAATPLFASGGYGAVGWVSVAAAVVHGGLAWSLPAAPPVEPSVETTTETIETVETVETIETIETIEPIETIETVDADDPDDPEPPTLLTRYLRMLSSGLAEASADPPVRHLVVIGAVLYGMTALDEYFGLVAREGGASTAAVPMLVALTVAGQLAGSALAGRSARLSATSIAAVVVLSGVALAAGALARHPAGFLAIAAGYGLLENAVVVSGAALQASITGPARATVTSVSGLLTELVSVIGFATVAAISGAASTPAIVAILCLPLLLVAVMIRRWWPPAP